MELIGQAIAQPWKRRAHHLFPPPGQSEKIRGGYRRMAVWLAAHVPLIFGYGLLSTEIIRMLFAASGATAACRPRASPAGNSLHAQLLQRPAIAAKGASKATLLVAIVQVTLTRPVVLGGAIWSGRCRRRLCCSVLSCNALQQYMLHKHTGIHFLKSVGVVWPRLSHLYAWSALWLSRGPAA